ncbi:31847_t:CDS:1, partial [Gigaspora margarita]
MSFMAAANDGPFSCAIYNLEDTPDMYTTWEPDPVGPDGTVMSFYVSQTLTEPSTVSTKLFFVFNDPSSGLLIGYTVHPVDENITVIQDTFNAIIPKKIPSTYAVTVMVKDVNAVKHCVSFTRNT